MSIFKSLLLALTVFTIGFGSGNIIEEDTTEVVDAHCEPHQPIHMC